MRYWGDPPPPETDDVFELLAYDFRRQYEHSQYSHTFAFRWPCAECGGNIMCADEIYAIIHRNRLCRKRRIRDACISTNNFL